jgi:predicted Rossmann fold nucleotide-binding protein DprA/Smf involved in DNA uptake
MIMGEPKRTIDRMKERRKVPADLRERVKETARIEKAIRQALADGPLTVPAIAERTGLPSDVVMFHVMTMRKFGRVEVVEDDDVDEYYEYALKKAED